MEIRSLVGFDFFEFETINMGFETVYYIAIATFVSAMMYVLEF